MGYTSGRLFVAAAGNASFKLIRAVKIKQIFFVPM